ncbi:MAG: hypothetical protein ACW964_19140 [Candidatus Hodarchaeales archaeon]
MRLDVSSFTMSDRVNPPEQQETSDRQCPAQENSTELGIPLYVVVRVSV